jgi:hypothetical protein
MDAKHYPYEGYVERIEIATSKIETGVNKFNKSSTRLAGAMIFIVTHPGTVP